MRVEPFAIRVRKDEQIDQTPDPTRPFFIRAVTYVRFGIGGKWGCIGMEVKRP